MIDSWIEFISTPGWSATAAMIIVKSTIMVAIGLGMHILMRRASPSARHAVLSATLLGVLLLPVISMLATPLEIEVSNTSDARIHTAAATRPSPTEAKTTARVDAQAVAPASAQMTQQTADSELSMSIQNALLFFYLGGLAAVLAYLSIGIGRVFLITRKARLLNADHHWQSLLPKRSGNRSQNRVRLCATAEIFAPVTWGVFRPIILMPTSADAWSDQDIQSALEHELAHVDRKDWITQIIASLVGAAHWFNPLVWAAIRRLFQEAELAADNRVLVSGVQATTYASQLVSLAQSSRETHLPVVATAMATKGFLSKRVQMILVTKASRKMGNRLGNLSLGTIVLATALLVGSTQFVQAAPEEATIEEDSLSTPLIRAAAKGDNDEVVRLLEAGDDVNETSNNRGDSGDLHRSALTTAAAAGHVDVVETLLDAGARVDRQVRGDATALIEATRNRHMDVTKTLVEHGADVNNAVLGDGSPLIGAAQANDADAVRYLLEAGADPDDSVMGDENPFYHASLHGNTEIMQMLIDAGVKVDQKWLGDGNALMLAVRSGDPKAVDLLVNEGVDPNQGVMGDGSAMIVAARRGDTLMLQKMIAAGGDINKSFRGEGSPLIVAARYDHLEAVALLVESGAVIDTVVKGEENALIAASWRGNLSVVDYLLSAGADPNINAPEGREPRTALRQARLSGHEDVVQRLIAGGATE